MAALEWAGFALAGLLWGSSFLWIKIGLNEFGPLTLVSHRLMFGVVGLLLLLRVLGARLPRDLSVWKKCAAMAVINPALPFVLITWAETRIHSSMASVLNASVPLFTLLFAHLSLDDEKASFSKLVGLLLGFLGVATLLSQDLLASHGQSVSVLGQLAVLAAAALYAASSVFAKKRLSNVRPVVQVTCVMICADALIWILACIFETPWVLPKHAITWVSVAWLGFLGTALAFFIYFSLIQRWGATRTSLVNYLFPMVGLVLGIVFLGEPVQWQLAVGSALIFSGVFAVNWDKLSKAFSRR
jgi:drug/metabolite transporter (DMT)-like permease